jgi:uncharacterized surface protein with fasciclin (FAS1) repeats
MKTTILGATLVVGLLAATSSVAWAADEPVAGSSAGCTSEEKGDILDTAAKAGSFTILARAIEAADLTATLKGEGPFTVFAPTDEAFGKLPPGALEQLLLPENKAILLDLLLGHVASGRIESSQIAAMSAVTTLEGEKLPVQASSSGILIGNAQIQGADILAKNGVIHVVNAVIIPTRLSSPASQEPANPPIDTVTPPQEPAVPEEPVTAPQEPAVSQQPTIAPQEPAIPEEPVAPPEEHTGCPIGNP